MALSHDAPVPPPCLPPPATGARFSSHTVHLDAVIRPIGSDGAEPGWGVVAMLSPRDCTIRGHIALPPGTLIHLSIPDACGGGPIEIQKAVIRWRSRSDVGVGFLMMKAEDQERLSALMRRLVTAVLDGRVTTGCPT
ncbi:hypothetical protein [Candidatus Nitrospira bockiana]